MAQLHAFLGWCKETMECLRAMQGNNDADSAPVSEEDGSNGTNDEKEDEKSLEELLMVNNSVVDNELGGNDVTVKVSWRKVWEGLKKRELKPVSWLETEHPQLCTMRWAGAFLCGVGNKWCGEDYLGWSRPAEALSSFYSTDMYLPLEYLKSVTCTSETEGCVAMMRSDEEDKAGAGEVAAYGYNDAEGFRFDEFEWYNFESESLRSSYPAVETNSREIAVAGLADSVILAKHLGVDKLSTMRRYFERYRLPTNQIWYRAVRLWLEQSDIVLKDDSPQDAMFNSLKNVPLPYQLQMVALWDECTNWRILQASAHQDINAQLDSGLSRLESLFDKEPLPVNIFEYCRRLGNTELIRFGFLGVSMETVRTFLGEWVSSAPDVVDWEPLIPTDSFEFSSSFVLLPSDRNRIIWDCQHSLQSELVKKSTAHTNMTSSAELIMLFILSMPVLRFEREEEEDGNANVSNGTGDVIEGENSDRTASRAHSSVNLSMSVYRAYSPLAPQNISVVVRFDTETRRMSLSLRHNGADGRFKWEDWVNSAMGCMKGMYEGDKERGMRENIEYAFRKVDLRKEMVELSPLYCGTDESRAERSPFDSDRDAPLMETGIVRVWTGWPAFDVRICKSEIDRWMIACNIDINNIELNEFGENWEVVEQIYCAEAAIGKVREVIVFDEDAEEEDNGISQALN